MSYRAGSDPPQPAKVLGVQQEFGRTDHHQEPQAHGAREWFSPAPEPLQGFGELWIHAITPPCRIPS